MHALRKLIPLNELPDHLPRRKGKKVSYSTVYRWATKGCRGKVLETERIGGVLYVASEAIDSFFFGQLPTVATNGEPADRSVAISRAERQLHSEGL